VPLLRLRVSDTRAVWELRQYLAKQGFPSSMQSTQELIVLFPGRPSIFAPAVELDRSHVPPPAVTVTVSPEENG
jgi:hypothetical protein